MNRRRQSSAGDQTEPARSRRRRGGTTSTAPLPPALIATPDQRPAKRLGGVTGKGFRPGQSGNPGGRPKGLKVFSVLRIVGEAMDDEKTHEGQITALRGCLTSQRRTIEAHILAARVNKEIGMGSEQSGGGVQVLVQTNITVGGLR